MIQLSLLIILSLTVFSAVVLSQNPVQITFQSNPVLVQTTTEIVFTLLTVSNAFTVTWKAPGGIQLGLWVGGTAYIDNVTQYLGRVSITANQLRISQAQLSDAGNYTVEVVPLASSGLVSNSQSVQLRVFVAVTKVNLSIPPLAVEGARLSLNCTWATGTAVAVQWGKGGSAVGADPRISISQGSLVIQPGNRGDAGEYSCTASNPVSAATATGSLTVYYGPEAPVMTRSTPAECVGGGDVVAGQTVRLTCASTSLPPALFSWLHNGQPVGPGRPDSGVLDVQTFTANQSGSYTCVARNAITGGTSEQAAALAVVGTCLSAGAVAGIVIGCVVALFLIILLILVLVRWRRVNQILENFMGQQKTNPNPRIIAPDLPPHEARNLGQGPHPPLHDLNTREPNNLYGVSLEGHSNPRAPSPNGAHVSNAYQDNERYNLTGLPRSRIQNTNSQPHNGVDNPAFTNAASPNADARAPQQNPNIVIQAGAAQHPTLHFSLNTDGNAQPPTVHVNLNSYPANGQPAQPGLPLQSAPADAPAASSHGSLRSQPDPVRTGQSYATPPTQRELPYIRLEPRRLEQAGPEGEAGRIPTGHTQPNSRNAAQTNSNAQASRQALDGVSGRSRHANPADSESAGRRRQMPWDRLRGTPPYPNGAAGRRRTSSSSSSTDGTDRPARTAAHRDGPRGRAASPRQHARPSGRRSQSPPSAPETAHPAGHSRHSETEGGAPRHTHTSGQSSGHTGGGSAQRFSVGPQSQAAPRQSAVQSSSLQALPLRSQQVSAARAAVSQPPRGPAAPREPDARALADPNHLPQVRAAQQIETAARGPAARGPAARGPAARAQPVSQPRQGVAPSAQPSPASLTQAALQAHAQRAQTFQNRNQQTQAALLHPGGPEDLAAIPVSPRRPPTPPPVIPLAQFQALPKVHKAPNWAPVNGHAAQRHPQRPRMQHHHPGTGPKQHANAHRHPAHLSQPPQQQTHRGRPR